MIDELDLRILEEIQEDGRKSFTSVAKVVGVSEATVRKRVKDMKKRGLMKIFAVLNPPMIGYGFVAMLGFHISIPNLNKVVSVLKKSPAVRYVAFVGGRYDLIALTISRTPEELSHFIRNMSSEEGVQRIEALVNLDIFLTPWLQPYPIRELINAKNLLSQEQSEKTTASAKK